MTDYYPPGEQCPRLMAQAKNRDSKWTWLPADVRTSYITITLASRQTRVESKTSVAGRPGSSFGLVSLEHEPSTEPFHLNRPKLYFSSCTSIDFESFYRAGEGSYWCVTRADSLGDSVPTTINIQLVPSSGTEHRVPRTTVSRNVAFPRTGTHLFSQSRRWLTGISLISVSIRFFLLFYLKLLFLFPRFLSWKKEFLFYYRYTQLRFN